MKTFEEIVSNYKDPQPEWTVEINGKDYSKHLELLEFTDSVNNPIKFTIKLEGVDSSDSIPEDAEVVVGRRSGELFRGILKEVNPNNLNSYTFKGAGYAAELESSSKQILESSGTGERFQDSDIQTVVDTLVDGSSLPNAKTLSTSYTGSVSTTVVDDFRVKKKQIEDVNRLMGEYDVEWYTTFDGSNSPVFNVTDQISFTDGGNPVGTLTTYGSQSAEMVEQNANRNKGDFDGVLVRGYGDGDDQITATSGSTGKGNRVLIYTDKTILSESQAQKRADNLADTQTVSWQEIEVKPSNPNQVYGVGDELKIESKEARLNDTYRVVKSYFKIWPGEDQFESKLNLSNKPQTFIDDFKQQQNQTDSQTDYSQGNRNTINESNSSIADSGQGTEIELFIPQDFVEDEAGNDRTAQVLLDFKAKDYNRLIPFGQSTVGDGSKADNPVLTDIDDFGNLEKVQTQPKEATDSNSTSSRWLGEDSDFENTGEGVEVSTNVIKPYRADSGEQTVLDLSGNGFASEEINFDTNFQSTPVINISMADPTSEPGPNELFRHWVDQADSNSFNVDANVPVDEGYTCNWTAKERIERGSVTIDGEVPSIPDTSGSSDRKNIVGVSYAAYIFNSADSDLGLTVDIDVGFYNDSEGLFVPSGSSKTYQNTILDSSIDENDSLTVEWDADFGDAIKSSPGSNFQTVLMFIIETISEQKHKVEQADAASDKVVAFTERKSDGDNIDASQGASSQDYSSQHSDDVAKASTVDIDNISDDELIVEKRSTGASSVDVYVDGTQVKSGLSLDEKNVDLTNDVSQGKNTVEIRPDDKAEVQGNIIVDHKISGVRK